jgi:hypothetical protein
MPSLSWRSTNTDIFSGGFPVLLIPGFFTLNFDILFTEGLPIFLCGGSKSPFSA